MTAQSTSQKKLWLRQCPRPNSLSRYLAMFNFPFQKKKTTKTKTKITEASALVCLTYWLQPWRGKEMENNLFYRELPKALASQ